MPDAPARHRRRGPWAAGAGGLVVIAVVIGVALWTTGASGSTGYRTAKVTKQTVRQTLGLSGAVEPVNQATAAFQVAGTVSKVAVQVGQQVKAGQTLATLATTTLQQNVNLAQTTLAAAQAQLTENEADEASSSGSSSSGSSLGASTAADVSGSGTPFVLAAAVTTTKQPPSGGGKKPTSGGTPTLKQAQQAVLAAQKTADADSATASAALAQAQSACATSSTPPTSTVPSSTTSTSTTLPSSSSVSTTSTTEPSLSTPAPSSTTSVPTTSVPSTTSTSTTPTSTTPSSSTTSTMPATSTTASIGSGALTMTSVTSTDGRRPPGGTTTTTTVAGSPTPPTTAPTVNGSSACAAALSTALAAEQRVTSDQQAVATAETTLAKVLSQSAAKSGTSGGSGSTGGGSTGSGSTGTGKSRGTTGTSSTGGTSTTGGTGAASSGSTAPAADSAQQLASDQATIDGDQASLIEAQQSLADAKLTSPITGTVATMDIVSGQTVSANSTTSSITLINSGSFEATASLTSTQVAQVKVGDQALVSVDGLTGTLTGTVSRVGPVSASGTSYTYPLIVALPAGSHGISGGSTAQVQVVLHEVTYALAVPTSAVHTTGLNASYVMVLKSGHETRTPVSVGAVGSPYTQITKGLTLGTTVVLADLSEAIPASSNATTGRFGGARLGGAGGGATGFAGFAGRGGAAATG